MSRWFNIAATTWTLTGLALLALEPATFTWWSPIWILLLFLSSYCGLITQFGLNSARISTGALIVAFSVVLALGALTGWPTGPLRFTENSGPRIASLFPALLPIFAFSILAASHLTCARLLASIARTSLCAATASLFFITLANSIAFLAGNRLWWLWNPWDAQISTLTTVGALISLGVVALALAFVFPPDTKLKTTPLTTALLPIVSLNVLFFCATFLFALRKS